MLIADLRIFAAVASCETLSAAARLLSVAPMQISRRVAALEAELGVRLFHRSTRSVSLTAEGEALLPYATTMIEAEDGAKNTLSPSPATVTGVLRMTAPSIFGQSIVLPVLSRLMENHPELKVELDLSDRVVDIVAHGLDLALRLAPLEDSELIARKILPNPRIICASPEYLARHGRPETLADLQSHHCVLLQAIPRWPLIVDGELKRQRVNGHLMTSSIDAVRTAAIQGLGLALLTYWDVFRQLHDGSLIEIHLQDAKMQELSIWAVMPTRCFVAARVKVFLDALEHELMTAQAIPTSEPPRQGFNPAF